MTLVRWACVFMLSATLLLTTHSQLVSVTASVLLAWSTAGVWYQANKLSLYKN